MTYAGDINVHEAAALLADRDDAVLIDVRTMAEWNWVGVPDLPGTRFVQWVSWPGGQPNPDFISEAGNELDHAQPLAVLCRSGARSAAAAHALTAAGFTEVYNISDGFEGDIDREGHRSGGWRGAGLPWRQS